MTEQVLYGSHKGHNDSMQEGTKSILVAKHATNGSMDSKLDDLDKLYTKNHLNRSAD